MSGQLIVLLPGIRIGLREGARWKVAVALFPWIALLLFWSVFAAFAARRIGPDASMGVDFLVTAWACVSSFVACCAVMSRPLLVYGLSPELLGSVLN